MKNRNKPFLKEIDISCKYDYVIKPWHLDKQRMRPDDIVQLFQTIAQTTSHIVKRKLSRELDEQMQPIY